MQTGKYSELSDRFVMMAVEIRDPNSALKLQRTPRYLEDQWVEVTALFSLALSFHVGCDQTSFTGGAMQFLTTEYANCNGGFVRNLSVESFCGNVKSLHQKPPTPDVFFAGGEPLLLREKSSSVRLAVEQLTIETQRHPAQPQSSAPG